MLPDFGTFLDKAAADHGVERREADHEINTLSASRPVEAIQNIAATASNLSGEGRKNYLELVDVRVRAQRVVADALDAYAADVRKSLGG